MASPMPVTTSGSGSKQEYIAGVRVMLLNLPEDEGEGLGFRLTRTLWDPYPWVREITPGGRADRAGLKMGDCILQADGRDLLGLAIGNVAGLIRGDGSGRSVTLEVWNCGVDPEDDPELLWSCGGGARGEKSRRALAGVVKALACSVCASTATKALNCARSHIYCEPCWVRLDKCALCREPLPAKNSPYAKNLVAEQVFEAIAAEYELKSTQTKRHTQSVSAYTSPNRSPNRSPNLSPSPSRRGQYQLSMMNKTKKSVHFNERFGPAYASDPNIHRSLHIHDTKHNVAKTTRLVENSLAGNSGTGGKTRGCYSQENESKIPKINIENVDDGKCGNGRDCCQSLLQHKLVARLRHACSLADLQSTTGQCPLSASLNNVDDCKHGYHSSLDNLKNNGNTCDSPVFLLPAAPIYVVNCDHNKKD